MDSNLDAEVCSVKKENNLGYYRIHTIWKYDSFQINIVSKDGAWTGEMTPENVQSFSSQLGTSSVKYLSDCREILTTDDGKKGFTYAVENGCFTWKKLDDEESGIKIIMGSVLLKPVSFLDTIQNVVDVLLNCKKNLKNEVNSLMKEKNREQERAKKFQMKLEELINIKSKMETELYKKFELLLNTKKRKIKELEDYIQSLKKTKNIAQCEKPKEYDNITVPNEYDMDTEDENEDDDTDNCKKFVIMTESPVKEAKKRTPDEIIITQESPKSRKVESEVRDNSPITNLDLKLSSTQRPTTANECLSTSHGRDDTEHLNINKNNSEPFNCESDKNLKGPEVSLTENKACLTTKSGILDYFFGTN